MWVGPSCERRRSAGGSRVAIKSSDCSRRGGEAIDAAEDEPKPGSLIGSSGVPGARPDRYAWSCA